MAPCATPSSTSARSTPTTHRSASPTSPTGQVDEVDAEDESTAAAIALTGDAEVLEADVLSYNPAQGLYGVAGEDEAVRVSSPA